MHDILLVASSHLHSTPFVVFRSPSTIHLASHSLCLRYSSLVSETQMIHESCDPDGAVFRDLKPFNYIFFLFSPKQQS